MADDDLLHTTEILKAALPYTDSRTKTTMDLLVKFYELIDCFRRVRSNNLSACNNVNQKVDIEAMLNSIRPLCKDKERSMVDTLLGVFNAKRMYEMYNTYMSAMKTMQEYGANQSDGEAADNVMNNFSGFDFSSIFGGSSEPNSESDSPSDEGASNSENSFDDYASAAENKYEKDTSNTESSSEKGKNDSMMDALKTMIPPDQLSTFENLRMLFNTMSYDDNSKPE